MSETFTESPIYKTTVIMHSLQFPCLFMGAILIVHRIAVRGRGDQVSNESNSVLTASACPANDSLTSKCRKWCI